MAVLEILAQRAGDVVSTHELLERVWPGVVVTDNAIHRVITQLRKALGDNPKDPTYIQSVPKKGYRFLFPTTSQSDRLGSLGQIGVGIKISSETGLVSEQLVVRTCSRYLDWRSAALQVLRGTNNEAHYVIDVHTSELAGVVTVNWEILETSHHQLIGTNTHSEASDDYPVKQASIAELIAESSASDILRHRLTILRRRENRVKPTYWDRLVVADRYRSMATDELDTRAQYLVEALELEPQLPYAYAAFADFRSWQLANGLVSDAATAIQEVNTSSDKAIELDPNDLYSLMRCGTALSRIGRYEDGVMLCRKAVELFPSVASKDFYAMALTFAGQSSTAIDVYLDLLGSLPHGRVYHYGRIVVPFVQNGEFEIAHHYAELATSHFPTDYFCWLLKCNLEGVLGNESEAALCYQKALAIMPTLNIEAVRRGIQHTYGRSEKHYQNLTRGFDCLFKP